MLDLRILNAGTAMPLFDLPAALGRRRAAREIGDTIEGLIAFMDDLGGDPDLEANGDELDGDARSEDSFEYHGGWGPGCPVADEDHGSEEAGEPCSWLEWHTRGAHKLESGSERIARNRFGSPMHDDAENDDPAEDDDADAEDDGREVENGL